MSVARAIPDDDPMTSSVGEWLTSVGLSEYTSKLVVDGGLNSFDQLLTLSRSDLQALGVHSRLHLDTLLDAISAVPRHVDRHTTTHTASFVVDRV